MNFGNKLNNLAWNPKLIFFKFIEAVRINEFIIRVKEKILIIFSTFDEVINLSFYNHYH